MEITWRVISGKVERAEQGKGTGNKKQLVGTKQMEMTDGDVKNTVGNGEAKNSQV